jgi:mono/diheme cytochrome c family protein
MRNRKSPDRGAPGGRGLKFAIWAGALALLAVGTAAFLLAPEAPPLAPTPAALAPLAPLDPARIAEGERLYAAACAACHGANLEGQPDWQQRRADGKLPAPPHDATGHSWHHPDAHLFAITKLGLAPFAGLDYATDMPAFENRLTDDEIRAVIEFIKSRWPDEIRARQAQIDAQARAQQLQ